MLLKLAALSALGYAGYKVYEKNQNRSQPAFAGNQGKASVRDAGPDAMRDKPAGWSKTDEASDASFPASDPPSTY
jgi:uncharacterized membrane protein YebE (DUF533 family)